MNTLLFLLYSACLHGAPSWCATVYTPPHCDYTVPVCYNYDPEFPPPVVKPGNGPRPHG